MRGAPQNIQADVILGSPTVISTVAGTWEVARAAPAVEEAAAGKRRSRGPTAVVEPPEATMEIDGIAMGKRGGPTRPPTVVGTVAGTWEGGRAVAAVVEAVADKRRSRGPTAVVGPPGATMAIDGTAMGNVEVPRARRRS